MKNTKTSIIYVLIATMHVLMVTLIVQNFINSEETIVIKADNPQTFEVEVEVEKKTIRFKSEVQQYIYEVFDEDFDKAMLLLKGKDGECAENRGLDPYAVNDNTTWGGVGRDRGVFQISDYYHPLTDEQAFDYKQNIDYAKRMFDNDGGTFGKRWTCGKHYAGLGYEI